MDGLERTAVGAVLIPLIITAVLGIGWCMNIYKVCTADWEAPYKNEGIRVVGAIIVPIGGIIGYVNIDDGAEE